MFGIIYSPSTQWVVDMESIHTIHWNQALLFETENTEYFIGIEMTDSCIGRRQFMIKEINNEREKVIEEEEKLKNRVDINEQDRNKTNK